MDHNYRITTIETARRVASYWHGGATSALYSMTSAGVVSIPAWREARRCLAASNHVNNRREVAALCRYIAAQLDCGDQMVCTDCYFAHHYGATNHDGQWFAGDSDTPCDREPLSRLTGYELSDNTDSETGRGIDTFSMSSCDGCGSHLGGSRYALRAVLETARPTE